MKSKIIIIIFLLLAPFCALTQNEHLSFISSFSKLQSDLSKEIGVKSLQTIELTSSTLNIKPYSLQIIGNSNYNLFLNNENLYSNIRILYLNDIDFSKVNLVQFDKLMELEAIRFKNCKNMNFENLDSNLSKSDNIKQIHFNEINFGSWKFNLNKTINLKVITFDNCNLKYLSDVELNIEEFAINKHRNVIDLEDLRIKRAKKVSVTESIVKKFPYSLSNNKKLEYLSLRGTKIKRRICKNILGFEDLLYLDITNSKINFNSNSFLDATKLLIINGNEVLSGDGLK